MLLNSCSTQRDIKISQKDQNSDLLKDFHLKKISNENVNNTILLLLPLSGVNANLGHGILNACILSANESQNTNIDFVVIDTADRSLDKNQLCWKYKSKNLRAIVGPIFFTEAKRYGALFPTIPMFTFSNNIKVNSNHIFACGLSPQNEINEIFSFARRNKIEDFLVMLPKGKYGDEIEQYLTISMKKFNFVEETDIEIIRYDSIERKEATNYVKSSGRQAVFILDPILDLEQLPKNIVVFTLSSHALQNREAWNGCIFAFSNIQELVNFSVKYKNVFGKTPSVLDMIGYDIINALCASANDPYEPFILENKELHGCLGNFSIIKNKGIKRELHLYKSE